MLPSTKQRLDAIALSSPPKSATLNNAGAGQCGKGWTGAKGQCRRAQLRKIGKEAKHVAEHLGENVAAWGVGKVVGGAIAQVGVKHGLDPEFSKQISETAVQALTATLIHARKKENRNAKELSTYFMAQTAAAYLGKSAHKNIDESLLGADAHVRQIAAMAAGKGTGIGIASGAKRTLSNLVNRFNVRSDSATRNNPLTAEEHEALFTLSLLGILTAQKNDRTSTRTDGEVKAYYFEDTSTGRKRNTAVFAESAEQAKKKLKRPSPDRARVYKVRSLLETEKQDLKTGRWSRIRASGKTPEQDPRGQGFFGARNDGRKVLPKVSGKRPGIRCGRGWISAAKKCKSHKSGGKLTAEGKSAAQELAVKVKRQKETIRGAEKTQILREKIQSQANEKRKTQGTPKAVLLLEDRIKKQSFESAAVFDSKGNLLFFKDGEKSFVEFSRADLAVMKGAIVTHNHPGGNEFNPSNPRSKGNSFSKDDFKLAAIAGVGELRAVSNGYRHSVKPPDGGWDARYWRDTLEPAFDAESKAVKNESIKKIVAAEKEDYKTYVATIDLAEANHWHEVAQRTAKKLGITYTREPYAETK